MIFRKKRPTIGLALGSGGARGYAHIGVIKALEKHGIPIDYMAGSSAGSLIGGIYASTKNISLIETLALQTNRSLITSFLMDPCLTQGFSKGTKFHEFIKKNIGETTFKDLAIPFTAVSTDLHTGERVLLKEGSVAEAIKISCSIPMLFKPVAKGKSLLTDGGISMPVPVQAVKDMGADIVIAVNLSQEYYDENLVSAMGITTIFLNTYGIMAHHLANEQMKQADIPVAPPLKHLGWKLIIPNTQKQEIIHLGEEFMEQQIPALQSLIIEKNQSVFSKTRSFFGSIPHSIQKRKQQLQTQLPSIKKYNINALKYLL